MVSKTSKLLKYATGIQELQIDQIKKYFIPYVSKCSIFPIEKSKIAYTNTYQYKKTKKDSKW